MLLLKYFLNCLVKCIKYQYIYQLTAISTELEFAICNNSSESTFITNHLI